MDNVWNRSLLRPITIATLVTAFLAGPLAVATTIDPQWRPGYVLVLLFLVALEAVYTTTWLAHPDRRQRRTAGFRVAELVTWLSVVRLLVWIVRGSWPAVQDLRRWFWAPLAFFDLEFAVVGVLVALAWAEGISNGGAFQELAMQPDELTDPPPGYELSDWRAPLSYTTSRSQILARFGQRWIRGALILVLCAAATQVQYRPGAGLQSFGIVHVGLPALMVAGLIVYFLMGLGLMSVGRLAALRARWLLDKTEGQEAVTRRWPRLTLLLLLSVGGLAAMLPLGSTWRLGTWLRMAIGFLGRWALIIGGYIMYWLTALLRWLVAALGLAQSAPPAVKPVPFETPQTPEALPDAAIGLPEWLGGALLWLLTGIVVVYALLTFLRGRGVRLEWGRLATLWLRVREWWHRWRQGVQRAARTVTDTVARQWAGRRTGRQEARPGWGLLNWRQLAPEAQVRLLYLFALRRAAQRGVLRPPTQTPYEHAPTLEGSWPEVQEEWGELTQAFIEARYSVRAFAADEVGQLRKLWKRVRSALRQNAVTGQEH